MEDKGEVNKFYYDRKPELFGRKVHSIFRLKGFLLDQVESAKELLGKNPQQSMASLVAGGLTEEEIAKKLSTEDKKINAFSVFILGRLFNIYSPSHEKRVAKIPVDRIRIVREADEKELTDDLTDSESIIFYTRFFGGPPMSIKRLAEDLGVSQEEIGNMENKLVERLATKLSGEEKIDDKEGK